MGINETKELFSAVEALSLLIVERMKDGAGIDDVTAIIGKLVSDDEFKAKMSAAFDGVKNVPAEMGDLKLDEIVELAGMGIAFIPKVVEAAKK